MSYFKLILEVVLLVAGIFTIVFQVARIESRIFATIDKSSDGLLAQIGDLDTRLKVHLTECLLKEKHFNSCLYELKKRTDNL